MSWYLSVLKNYAGFSGRARRKEYWMFALFNFIILMVLSLLAQQVSVLQYVYDLYALATIIPGLAVAIRRLHDTGRSGWWVLIGIIPVVGWIWLLVLLVGDSQGDNGYGPNPKAAVATA